MKQANLTADDWAAAALDAIARGGLAAVSVESLARELNVTKGSFYWHFRSRQALIQAALALWEKSETDDIFALAQTIDDPRKRLNAVFREATTSSRTGRLMLALAAASDDPVIGEFIRRVTKRRLEFVRDCYIALGQAPEEARRWATFAYSTFVGGLQLARDNPDALPQGSDMQEYLRLCINTLVPRQPVLEPVRKAG
nr:TetR/AcrR family transcriptional regulator [Oceanococcus sp. HetDA_MAG_MS8]